MVNKDLQINREAWQVRSSPVIVKAVQGRRSVKVGRICWKGRFWAWSERVKEWWTMRVVMITEMSWQVNEEVSRDMTGEADEIGSRFQRRGDAYEWAICDFQWGDGWWARKNDNRWFIVRLHHLHTITLALTIAQTQWQLGPTAPALLKSPVIAQPFRLQRLL